MALISFTVDRGEPTWLALQRPSEFKIQVAYIENGDQILYHVLSCELFYTLDGVE